ncbi:class I SAM-dependent methyltransferase [Ktedonosporobacter rubrisoli]|uniref:Class I SAM-dependent methyltransferase n=1 Tax=Ktedonosporobacter rubrisoli TaxID=2509675 RepID=A0A4P6JVF5_KTERU|nr:class I SAM-dependent methyltransferase [Ktedonosporobacter rubrisoli]QBD78936.1 class I SAM-dependent methyltransferase [Ktedonosporobacter rubrisoli]
MTTSVDPPGHGFKSVYVSARASGELPRPFAQDHLLTKGTGVLPAQLDPSRVQRVLDVACGCGRWVHEVAQAYPRIEAVGFDTSRVLINFARAQARSQGLRNAHFLVMDLQQHLDFPNHTFDLVNARFLNFLPAQSWTRLMHELGRITRPGGIIRLTESEWWYFTNSPALESLNALVIQALKKQYKRSRTGYFTGVLPLLGRFLREAGCTDITQVPYVIDFSAGTELYEIFRRDAAVAFKLFQPTVVKMQIATQEELDKIYKRMTLEMQKADFRGLLLPISAWGTKA